MTRLKITIGISEEDLQEGFHDVVYSNGEFNWVYPDETTGEDVDVRFISQQQLEQEEENANG